MEVGGKESKKCVNGKLEREDLQKELNSGLEGWRNNWMRRIRNLRIMSDRKPRKEILKNTRVEIERGQHRGMDGG